MVGHATLTVMPVELGGVWGQVVSFLVTHRPGYSMRTWPSTMVAEPLKTAV